MLPTSSLARLRGLAVALLLVAAGGALGAPADATDDAFGALLAMPGAQPKEGGWIIPQAPAANEAALIAQWRRLKKQGADVDALRHGGTLLAHAIRAGKDQAAIWLLHNGADPHKTLFGQPVDAYALARKYGRSAVVTVLEREYGFKPARPVAAAKPAAVAPAPAVATTRLQQAAALLERLNAPAGQPDAAAQDTWRQYAATLSDAEFRALFKDGAHIEALVSLTRLTDGGMEAAFARLRPEDIRPKAQEIATMLRHWSFPLEDIRGLSAAHAWPALWRRLDKPLDYRAWPELAGSLPPDLWPGLFASGYAVHDAEATGCRLAIVDLAGLRALWPEFQRDFVDAREAAPGLVLAAWRIADDRNPCAGAAADAEVTAAKLAFLREQGVTAPAYGLLPLEADAAPALAAQMAAFAPHAPVAARLVRVPSACTLALTDAWWTALAKVRSVGWGVPANAVQLLDVPGQATCGLFVSGDQYDDYPRDNDSFDDGPSRDPPTPRCADAPEDGEVWTSGPGGVGVTARNDGPRGEIFGPRAVRDVVTGKRYVLNDGGTGAACVRTNQLPEAFDWRVDDRGAALVPSADAFLVASLLRRQCHAADDTRNAGVVCPGIDSPDADTARPATLERLRAGDPVRLHAMLDAVGQDRRAAYLAAIAAHDHAPLRRLLAAGVPAWWTADAIKALAKADLPLEEKRRRIALLFADADQLAAAFHADSSDLPDSLAPWLPRQDWSPILRMVAKAPGVWSDMAGHVRASLPEAIGCDLDRAQQFVCGGGIKPD